jgi:ferritin
MNLDPTVTPLLERQVNAELYAAHLYIALGAWADAQGFPGLQGWANASALEEDAHARHFLAYLNDRLPAGAMATIGAVAAPPTVGDYAGALQAALTAEQAVSMALTELATVAFAAGDSATHLIATQQLLNEQIPAEREISTYLLRVGRGAPLDLLDGELYE